MCLRGKGIGRAGTAWQRVAGPQFVCTTLTGSADCLHDPYRVCGLSARPLPGLRIVCTTLTGSADCLHDPYRVCGLSARPLPGLRIVCTALTRPALGGRADEAPRSETRDD